jgi:anti-sigma B factor antagonist
MEHDARMNSQPPTDGPAPSSARRVVADIEQYGDVQVVVVEGEVDALTAPQVVEAVDSALAQQPRVLVVDLSGVDFLASAGLSALVEGHNKAGEGGRFRVVAAGPATRRVLELTGLTDQLAVFASRADALAG